MLLPACPSLYLLIAVVGDDLVIESSRMLIACPSWQSIAKMRICSCNSNKSLLMIESAVYMVKVRW